MSSASNLAEILTTLVADCAIHIPELVESSPTIGKVFGVDFSETVIFLWASLAMEEVGVSEIRMPRIKELRSKCLTMIV